MRIDDNNDGASLSKRKKCANRISIYTSITVIDVGGGRGRNCDIYSGCNMDLVYARWLLNRRFFVDRSLLFGVVFVMQLGLYLYGGLFCLYPYFCTIDVMWLELVRGCGKGGGVVE